MHHTLALGMQRIRTMGRRYLRASAKVTAVRYPHGEQPALNIIWESGLTVSGVARKINVSRGRLYHALRGGDKIPLDIRDALAKIFALPLEQLFTASALERPNISTLVVNANANADANADVSTVQHSDSNNE
jgi:transcriptional regulator with XRE-family HTH domain